MDEPLEEPTPAPEPTDVTPTNEEVIEDAMSRPKAMTVDGTQNTQHGLKEMQDAQERIAATAARRPGRGISFTKLRFPGAR